MEILIFLFKIQCLLITSVRNTIKLSCAFNHGRIISTCFGMPDDSSRTDRPISWLNLDCTVCGVGWVMIAIRTGDNDTFNARPSKWRTGGLT